MNQMNAQTDKTVKYICLAAVDIVPWTFATFNVRFCTDKKCGHRKLCEEKKGKTMKSPRAEWQGDNGSFGNDCKPYRHSVMFSVVAEE